MWCWLKKRLKSKTHLFTTLVGVLGILETHYGMLREYLGIHYSWSFMLVMLVGYLLREYTKQSVDDKE